MLLHEVHRVAGASEDAFDEAYRDRLMPALAAEELAEVFRQARRWGVKTVLDIVLPGPGDHLSQLAPVLRETDYFLPNTDEAAAITGLTDPRAQAARFREAIAVGRGPVCALCPWVLGLAHAPHLSYTLYRSNRIYCLVGCAPDL